MPDDPAPAAFQTVAAGDQGTVAVKIVQDWGHELQVIYELPGFRQFFWIRKADFVPAPPLAP
jgi:hypothetical protein